MDDLSKVEGVASAIQFIASQVGKYFGGIPAQAAATFLTGEVSFTASITDLAVKLQKGTATSEDVAEVFSKTSSALAGLGVMLGVANPIFLGITGAASGALFAYKNFVPEEKKQVVWESIFKKIFENSVSEMVGFDNGIINNNVSQYFLTARTWRFMDPLALDLDGDGIETIGITADKQILFDHNGDGVKAGTGWIKADDALLVLDRNDNGVIDNGSELFGVDTVLSNGKKATTGFAALTDLDSNRDGIFNSADARYAQVQLWRDLDQDGMSDSGELQTLADAGIASINLNSVVNRRDLGNGNVQTDTANFTRTDGSIGTAANLNFASNAFYREFGDNIALTTETSGFANLRGAGMVRDLREAATIDAKLIQDVNGLSGLSRVGMMSQLDQLLQDWAGTADFKTSQQRAADMGLKLLFCAPDATAAEMKAIQRMGDSRANLSEVLAELGVTTERYNLVRSKAVELGKIIGVLEAFNGQTFIDFSDSGDLATGNGIVFFRRPVTNTLLGSLGGDVQDTVMQASLASTNTVVMPWLSVEQIDLLKRSYVTLKESVYGGLVSQTRLKGYLDAVSLEIGGDGISMNFAALDARLNNNYEKDPVGTFIDCLELQSYVDNLSKIGWQGAARLSSWASDMASKGTLDLLRAGLAAAYAGSSNGIPEIRVGSVASESISARDSSDILIGLSGNDILLGYGGNDLLDGGLGNDSLVGGDGSDVYLFSRGGGQDMVNNYDISVGKIDRVQFAADIARSDVQISRSDSDLVLSIKGTTDKLTISNYFSQDAAGSYKIEEIRFSDGMVWNVETVKALALLPTASDDRLWGYATADTINGGDGNDRLVGYAGDDILSGDNGNDIIYAGDGNDTVSGGEGNDYLSCDNGNDVVNGGAGNDAVYGDNGNDILDGGAGNDYLIGGNGSDVYLFGRGSGQDSVNNSDTTVGKTDAIQFAADVASTDVQISRSETDLVLSIKGTTDKLTVLSYFSQDAAGGFKVEEIRFADGTVWNVDAVKSMAILATSGDDKLYGYANADTITGGDGNDRLMGYAGDDTLSGDNGNDTVYAGDGNDTVHGGEGNDYLSGENGNDVVNGGAGNDTVYGDNGNDILDGGAGNDYLIGGIGNDVYLFGRGSGQDSVNNYDATVGKVDVVQFAADVASTDVQISRSEVDLVLSIKGTTDKLTVSSYFYQDALGVYKLEEIRFADGTVWNVDAIKTMALVATTGDDKLYGYATADTITGGDGNDRLTGYAGDDVLSGDNGNDTVYAGDGNDTVHGGEGNDYLSGENGNDVVNGGAGNDAVYGDNGNDILDGGAGNDYLIGGNGNDVYLFGRGSGQDSVNNYDATVGKVDVVQFAADVASTDVQISRSEVDLVLSIKGTTDKLTVSSYFYQDALGVYKLEEIRFADGTVWNVDAIKTMALVATTGDDKLYGYATADTITGGDGNDRLMGYAGDDVLSGDNGNDTVYAGDGNDTVHGGEGNDYLSGENGNDVVNGGAGTDTLYGDNGNDILDGGIGDDSLYGNAGTDILQGGAGNDYFSDSSGAGLFDGGLGNDTINGGANAEIFVGGQGNDTYSTGAGNDILLFNKGDGQDSFAAGGTGNDTVSLGGSGLNYADLALAKSGTDLVLKVGAVDQITFRNWYASTPTRPIATLQVIAEAMDDFAQGGSDPLKDQRVERFNFTGLVETFDAARTANSGVSSWALTNALSNFSQGGSDTAAVGGDFAYQYGKNGTFAGMGVTTALNTLSDVNLGATSQALTAPSGQQSGAIRLS